MTALPRMASLQPSMKATLTPKARKPASTSRYLWAGEVARVAMGKKKWYGGIRDAAAEDPLAWWCLTEAIATGGP